MADKPACWYGSKCFRKNPNHLAQYYHPPRIVEVINVDDDEDSDANGGGGGGTTAATAGNDVVDVSQTRVCRFDPWYL
jgi:hypothetical protein